MDELFKYLNGLFYKDNEIREYRVIVMLTNGLCTTYIVTPNTLFHKQFDGVLTLLDPKTREVVSITHARIAEVGWTPSWKTEQ